MKPRKTCRETCCRDCARSSQCGLWKCDRDPKECRGNESVCRRFTAKPAAKEPAP